MSIEATGIRKRFGDYTALEGVDLKVETGSLVALLGPSGSGKTTLLRILAGLEFPDAGSGRVVFHGRDVSDVPTGKREVGLVFQHYALFRHLSVLENVAFGLRVRPRRQRPAEAEIRRRALELLDLVQMSGLEGRLPSELSGGQRQRVALARALAVEPRVLLLDEPFGALDAKVRKELRRWLRSFHDRVQLTTVFVTHDQEEALELADEVVVMNHARIEQVGTPQEVYDRPATPFVAEFLGSVNKLCVRGASGPLYVRPHEVELAKANGVLDAGAILAEVVQVHAAGPFARAALRCVETGQTVEAELPRERATVLGLRPGTRVQARIHRSMTFSYEI